MTLFVNILIKKFTTVALCDKMYAGDYNEKNFIHFIVYIFSIVGNRLHKPW